MNVAVEAIKHRRPKEIVVAIPVASATGFREFQMWPGDYLCSSHNAKYYLADFYRNWRDIGDDEVMHSLEQWRQRHKL